MILRGEMVVLREKRLDDAYQDYLWRTDEELAKLDATLPLQTRFASYRAFYADELQFPQPFKYKFAIDSLQSGRHIGNCMYYDLDPDRAQAEVGIMIGDKDYWSQGYGTETVGLLLDHMFQEYPFNRVYLHTLSWNHRAQKSFHKSGFKDVKPVRRGGLDFIQMEIWRHEWDAMRAASATESMDESSACS